MSPRAVFNLVVGAVVVLAIVLVAGPKIDLGGGDDGEGERGSQQSPATGRGGQRDRPRRERQRRAPASPPREPERTAALPANPDEVKGSQEISLHRPANLRRALRVLERERRRNEGVFDGLRVAPGRIDTTIDTPDEKITIQLRPDFRIAFRSRSSFPNASDPRFRRRGLGAGAVDARLPARILRRIDRVRLGSAARDLDYFVIRRDIIDFQVEYGAYLRSGPRPRTFLLEPGRPLRAIG